ncbi:membrane protein [Vibrio ishigakensis]|uniref:Probable membrane transporter protein n=1 Tax=Vibrio ishigakensis TaxID=1481914 RepID=A0A0B8QEJ6_9VIBR|nr:membrane protein [Vibrio ishigakensis]
MSHIRAGNVEWGSLWFMLLGAVPSTLLITKVVIYLNAHDYYGALLNQLVDIAIVAVMLVSLLSLYWKKRSVEKTTDASTVVRGKPVALCAGGVCGAVLGSTGVGGGVMLLPAFNSLLGVDLKKSIGSSVVMALVLSGITAVSYSSGGQSELSTAILMTVGAFAGIPVAIRLVDKFTEQQLYSLTFTVIIVSLVLMLGF